MDTVETPTEVSMCIKATGLEVISGVQFPDIEVPAVGLTLIHTDREQAATTLSMTLCGRMKEASGSVIVCGADGKEFHSPKQRFLHTAIAGVPEIDSLERLVPVRTVIREQAAWHEKWWKPTPRNIDTIASYRKAADLLGFDMDNEAAKRTLVGQLDPYRRFVLRIVLAIMSRPDAALLLVDDIDQLRSLELRNNLLRNLRSLSATMPVVAMSVNPDTDAICHHVVAVHNHRGNGEVE